MMAHRPTDAGFDVTIHGLRKSCLDPQDDETDDKFLAAYVCPGGRGEAPTVVLVALDDEKDVEGILSHELLHVTLLAMDECDAHARLDNVASPNPDLLCGGI